MSCRASQDHIIQYTYLFVTFISSNSSSNSSPGHCTLMYGLIVKITLCKPICAQSTCTYFSSQVNITGGRIQSQDHWHGNHKGNLFCFDLEANQLFLVQYSNGSVAYHCNTDLVGGRRTTNHTAQFWVLSRWLHMPTLKQPTFVYRLVQQCVTQRPYKQGTQHYETLSRPTSKTDLETQNRHRQRCDQYWTDCH